MFKKILIGIIIAILLGALLLYVTWSEMVDEFLKEL